VGEPLEQFTVHVPVTPVQFTVHAPPQSMVQLDALEQSTVESDPVFAEQSVEPAQFTWHASPHVMLQPAFWQFAVQSLPHDTVQL
jgi:hypothetical protein